MNLSPRGFSFGETPTQSFEHMAKCGFAIRGADSAIVVAILRGKTLERAIVGEYPVAPPQFALKRVAIFEANDTARGFANVRHNLFRLNGIRANEFGNG